MPETIIYTEDLGEAPYAHPPVYCLSDFLRTVRTAFESDATSVTVVAEGVVVGEWAREWDEGWSRYILTRDPRHL